MFEKEQFRMYVLTGIITFIMLFVAGFIIFQAGFNAQMNYKWTQTFYILSNNYYRNSFFNIALTPNLSKEKVLLAISQNIPCLKICKNSIKEKCWPEKSYFLNGEPITWDSNLPGFILPNNVLVSHINNSSYDCNETQLCNVISIDLNGFAPPNKFGTDEYRIYYYKNKVLPYDSREDSLVGDKIKKPFNIK